MVDSKSLLIDFEQIKTHVEARLLDIREEQNPDGSITRRIGDGALMNARGVSANMGFLSLYLNENTIFSKLKENAIQEYIVQLKPEFTFFNALHARDFGLKAVDDALLISQCITAAIMLSLKQADDGHASKTIRDVFSKSQNTTANSAQQAPKII